MTGAGRRCQGDSGVRLSAGEDTEGWRAARLDCTRECANVVTEIRAKGRGIAAFGTIVGVLLALAPHTAAVAGPPTPTLPHKGGGSGLHTATIGPAQVLHLPARSSTPPQLSAEAQAELQAAIQRMNRHPGSNTSRAQPPSSTSP